MAEYHILPINDEIRHDETVGCWCRPKVEDVEGGRLVVHRSADGRELLEDDAVTAPATRH